MTTVLGILQNQWLNRPVYHRKMADLYGERYIDRLNSFALFRGCLTGRRILAAFRESARKFLWSNASPIITDSASECPPPDPDYIRFTLGRLQPSIILCFGKQAANGISMLGFAGDPRFVFGPHPAARHYGVTSELAEMNIKFLKLVELQANAQTDNQQPHHSFSAPDCNKWTGGRG